jgi:hypothetical protein
MTIGFVTQNRLKNAGGKISCGSNTMEVSFFPPP